MNTIHNYLRLRKILDAGSDIELPEGVLGEFITFAEWGNFIQNVRNRIAKDTPEYLPGESRNPYGIPRSYITYYVKSTNKHYVWDSTLQEYKPQFTLYDQTTQGEWNRVYVEQIIDNVNHTYIGRAYKWDTGYYAKLPFSYNSSTGEYEDDVQYKVDAVTASKVLAYYAAQSIRDEEGSYDGYYYQGEFYTTMGHQIIIQTSHEEGSLYFDITTEYPEVVYKYEDGVYKPYTTKPGTTKIYVPYPTTETLFCQQFFLFL